LNDPSFCSPDALSCEDTIAALQHLPQGFRFQAQGSAAAIEAYLQGPLPGRRAAQTDAPTVDAEPAATASPQALAAWDKWRADENAAWAGKEFAILKIDDAVYLNDGQSAWLTNKKQKVLQYAWTLDA
jgi:hypothetical protein